MNLWRALAFLPVEGCCVFCAALRQARIVLPSSDQNSTTSSDSSLLTQGNDIRSYNLSFWSCHCYWGNNLFLDDSNELCKYHGFMVIVLVQFHCTSFCFKTVSSFVTWYSRQQWLVGEPLSKWLSETNTHFLLLLSEAPSARQLCLALLTLVPLGSASPFCALLTGGAALYFRFGQRLSFHQAENQGAIEGAFPTRQMNKAWYAEGIVHNLS